VIESPGEYFDGCIIVFVDVDFSKIEIVIRSGAHFVVRLLVIGYYFDGIAWIVHVILPSSWTSRMLHIVIS
jgi:hypothetical protein